MNADGRTQPFSERALTAPEKIEQARQTRAEILDLSGMALDDQLDGLGDLVQLRTLNIANCKLTALPSAIGKLVKLERLDASANRLSALPLTIGQLSALRFLDISTNLLSAIPLEVSACRGLERLHAWNNRLDALPPELCHLDQLRELTVADNQLTFLPERIGDLKSLQVLNASGNQLTALPYSVGRLRALQILDLEDNRLSALPSTIGRLTDLRRLWIARNMLTALPDGFIGLKQLAVLDLHDNQLRVPPEVLGPHRTKISHNEPPASPAAIVDFFLSNRVSRPLNEAKMILVGRGGVGKTSIVQRLVHGSFNAAEAKTDGIAITPWSVRIRGDDVRLNIWDFGGQEIMHATHQFFLTKRSLYLLVLNAREGEQDANIEYWLQMIESFGGESPVLVVINKVRDHPFDLNRRGLQAKYPSLRGFIQTDCDADTGIDGLRLAIERETDRLEHLRDPFPASWFAVKEALADLPRTEGQNFIPFSRYQAICAEQGVPEARSQETLVSFLHDLGIVVNFREDPRLAETHVLNPEWVTNGIYKLLNANELAARQGELRLADMRQFLDAAAYPTQMHLYLVDLMQKFELCYPIRDTTDQFLVPELLGKEEPDLREFDNAEALRFEYRYNVLPEGLLPRFIVRSRELNSELSRWRTGAVLQREGNRAVVKADVQARCVTVAVVGPLGGRRRLLSIIRADLEQIHASISKLQAAEHVPVPGRDGLVIPYKKLQAFEINGVEEFVEEHQGEVVKLNVGQLLHGLEGRSPAGRQRPGENAGRVDGAVSLAISYSHQDDELRQQLNAHLKLLQRQGVVSAWDDRRLSPGDHWADVIDESFKRADVILLLVSSDFLASDYCYEIEMQTALDREARGEARVIPVILRACDWSDAPFAALQGLPTDAKPVQSWSNVDEAWLSVAKGIKKVAGEMLATRGSAAKAS